MGAYDVLESELHACALVEANRSATDHVAADALVRLREPMLGGLLFFWR